MKSQARFAAGPRCFPLAEGGSYELRECDFFGLSVWGRHGLAIMAAASPRLELFYLLEVQAPHPRVNLRIAFRQDEAPPVCNPVVLADKLTIRGRAL